MAVRVEGARRAPRARAPASGDSSQSTRAALSRAAPRPAASVSARCSVGRVVLGQRRRDPALRPEAGGLGQRRAAHERHARALVGRHEGREQPRRAGADDGHVGAQGVSGGHSRRVGTVPARVPILFRHPSSLEHDTGSVIPSGRRGSGAIEAELAERDWLGCERASRRPPRRSSSCSGCIHASTWTRCASSARRGGAFDLDTPLSPGSWDAALHAAGGACALVESLLGGASASASARCARPGHHAEAARAMGFCLFANVPSPRATRSTRSGSSGCWCSTGTCTTATAPTRSSTSRPTCSSSSIHQYPLYPGTGPLDGRGRGRGRGLPINLPVPGGTGEAVFCSLVEHVVAAGGRHLRARPRADLRRLRRAPRRPAGRLRARDLLVRRAHSAGAQLGVPVGAVLEGGYDLDALADSTAARWRLGRRRAGRPGRARDRARRGRGGPLLAARRRREPPERDGTRQDEARRTQLRRPAGLSRRHDLLRVRALEARPEPRRARSAVAASG